MKRGLLFVTAIILTLSLYCALAIAVGRSQPTPTLFSNPGACNQAHCLLGIVPGKTSWLDAQKQFPNSSLDMGIQTQIDANTQVFFMPASDFSRVDTASVSFVPGTGPTLSALVATYGTPCVMSIGPGIATIILYYQDAYVTIAFSNNRTEMRLTPATQIDSLSLQSEWNSCEVKTLIERPWSGFRNYSLRLDP